MIFKNILNPNKIYPVASSELSSSWILPNELNNKMCVSFSFSHSQTGYIFKNLSKNMMIKKKLHTFSYYGGKLNMVNILCALLNADKSKVFISLFTGGASVEMYKDPHKIELWNDTNNAVVNYYKIVKCRYTRDLLINKIKSTSYSSYELNKSAKVYNFFIKKPPVKIKDKILFAWAFITNINLTFSSSLKNGFSYSFVSNKPREYVNRIERINLFAERIKYTQILCEDAVNILKKTKMKSDIIYYADPPYYNANMGHYKGYTLNDFESLLKELTEIKGKFILSSYNSEILLEYTKKFNWHKKEITSYITASNYGTKKRTKTKTEVITTNYNPDSHIINLFD